MNTERLRAIRDRLAVCADRSVTAHELAAVIDAILEEPAATVEVTGQDTPPQYLHECRTPGGSVISGDGSSGADRAMLEKSRDLGSAPSVLVLHGPPSADLCLWCGARLEGAAKCILCGTEK